VPINREHPQKISNHWVQLVNISQKRVRSWSVKCWDSLLGLVVMMTPEKLPVLQQHRLRVTVTVTTRDCHSNLFRYMAR